MKRSCRFGGSNGLQRSMTLDGWMKRSCRFGGSNGVGVLEQLEQLEEGDKVPYL